MHDSLGADLSRIALLAEMARYQSNPADALQQIGKIASIARGLVDSINELVWATDPHHNSIDALAAYLREYAAELLEPTGLAIGFDIPDRLPSGTISGELRRHLFLATKEALNNVLKHSQATEIRLAFDATEKRVKIAVTDNGCGFCAASEMPVSQPPNLGNSASSGNGLRNLHKRLSAVGGCVQINSVPGCGTRVAFTVPLTNHPSINGAKYDHPAPIPTSCVEANRKIP
jgi:signal transduction histidine kinase